MIANGSIQSQQVSGTAQEHPVSSGSSNWLGRILRVMACVTCLVSGVIAAVTVASGLYPLAGVFGLVSVVSGLVMLFCGSKNAVGASETSGQQYRQSVDNNHNNIGNTSDFSPPYSSHNNIGNVSGFKPSYTSFPTRPAESTQHAPLPTLNVPSELEGVVRKFSPEMQKRISAVVDETDDPVLETRGSRILKNPDKRRLTANVITCIDGRECINSYSEMEVNKSLSPYEPPQMLANGQERTLKEALNKAESSLLKLQKAIAQFPSSVHDKIVFYKRTDNEVIGPPFEVVVNGMSANEFNISAYPKTFDDVIEVLHKIAEKYRSNGF